MLKVTFMGTGTSHGIPMIGCRCPVCRSEDPRNRRTRCGLLIESQDGNWLIDTPTEFRLQALREKLTHVEAVFYTHAHADHILGLDDLRVFTVGKALDIYGSKQTLRTIRSIFPYAFKPPKQAGGGFPSLIPHPVSQTFFVGSRSVTPLPVLHGQLPVFGYRIGPLVYITDASLIPKETLEKIRGCRVLILNALRHFPHPTHLSLAQAVAIARQTGAERVFLTHICHNLDHHLVNAALPDPVKLAFDGLSFTLDEG